MAYPPYYDLSTKPVRQNATPTKDPDEAPTYHMPVALWKLGQEQREARRRIVVALKSRLQAVEPPPIAP